MQFISYNTATCHFKLFIYIASCVSIIGETKIYASRQYVNFPEGYSAKKQRVQFLYSAA